MSPHVLRIGILGAVVLVACAVELARRSVNGRLRAVGTARRITEVDLGGPLGEHATLLQVSSSTCTTCRAVRRVLGEAAEASPGVRHVELDAEEHLELVRAWDILRTPTVFVLDGAGAVVCRSSGQITPAKVREALARVPTPN